MRLSTVYAVALASAAAPAVLAIPLDSPRADVAAAKDDVILHELSRRLDADESGALSDALIQTVLEKRMPKASTGGGGSSGQGGSSRSGGGSSSTNPPPTGGSLLNRISPANPQQQPPPQQQQPSLLNRIAPAAPQQQQQSQQRPPHNVQVQYNERVLASDPNRQTTTLNQVERHMTNYRNAPQLRQAGATDAIIHSAPHSSNSEGGRPHATYNVYDNAGQLTHGGHAPGRLFTPTDPAYAQRW
ncbi:hypothetical protein K474DRAFT_485556 [Panus rudis PR-1116 ss-1]|nr:hypothetical protein K474DRAFT_485556 [Panus rudis PR-1116 ss-1]